MCPFSYGVILISDITKCFQDTVSVHKPSYYAKRFLDFIKDTVFTRVAGKVSLVDKIFFKLPMF